MNKHISRMLFLSAFAIAGMVGGTSCTDYLDKAPESDYGENDPYKNFTNFQGFVEELYDFIPLVSNNRDANHNCFNYGEDEYWEPTESRLFANDVDDGNFWGWQKQDTENIKYYGYPNMRGTLGGSLRDDRGNLWGMAWYGIRKANVGIAHLDQLTGATDEERNLIEGQLYFFRAWFHFMLMEWWGGMPYIDTELSADVSPTLPRLTWQECAEKCVADFDHAAGLLPVDWDDTATGTATLGRNDTRINKIMCIAYKGKTLLWAGSPLMNWSSGGAREYNVDYCKRAADALGEALTLTETTGRYELAAIEDYNELFLVHGSNTLNGLNEAIFRENLFQYENRWRWNMVNDFRPKSIVSTGIKCYPTANYVNYFGMKNGYPLPEDITQPDTESGYNPKYPWKDRDPRFYKIIMFDGTQYQSAIGPSGSVELFTNGRDSEEKDALKGCFTGYMNMKFCPQILSDAEYGNADNNIVVLSLMRLADVYLMYSEATAVGYGSPNSNTPTCSKTALNALNFIRDRAGVAHVIDKFLVNTEEFLKELRRERAVELAFEGFRFTDLRRWMLLTQRPYTLKTKIEFDRAGEGSYDYNNPENNPIKNLREVQLKERNFTDRHYWLPLPREDVNMYEGFSQNPGW